MELTLAPCRVCSLIFSHLPVCVPVAPGFGAELVETWRQMMTLPS